MKTRPRGTRLLGALVLAGGLHRSLVATLFVRSLERGERVYLAMMGRVYDGSMPETATGRLTDCQRPTWCSFRRSPPRWSSSS